MRKIFFLIILFSLVLTANMFAQNLISQADSLWEKRGDVFDQNTLIADSANINQAISIYKGILQNIYGN